MEFKYEDWSKLTLADLKEQIMNNRGQMVIHFKGNKYLVEDLVMMDNKSYVLYKALYGTCGRYIRPVREFFDWVADRPDNKAGNKMRFEFIHVKDVREV